MLAGCSSSTLLSPRHSLRSEASHQACHFQLPSMSTQRLDLPCSFSRKDASRPHPQQPIIRPPTVGLPLEKQPVESNNRSLKQSIRLPPLATSAGSSSYEGRREIKDEFWEKGKSLKRLAEQSSVNDSSYMSRAKRKKGSSNGNGNSEDGGNAWFQQNPHPSHSQAPFSLTYSGDEGKACFVPGLPLSHSPWFSQITDSGEKDAEIIRRSEREEASGSSTSSESSGLGLRLAERRPAERGEVGHGGSGSTRKQALVEESSSREHEEGLDLQLVNFLVACIEAISSKNIPAVNHFIAKLGDLASPRGRTSISRLIAYYTEGLALRVTRLWPHIFHITSPRELDSFDDDNGSSALRLLNQVSPIPKFIHFTANEILLRAFEGKDKVHIIDFDIKQGLQWPSFFQSLASRANPPSHVRITGIGDSKQELNETGDRLTLFAEAMNLPFEFHPVVDRLEDVRLWMLHVKEKESVAVNCIFQLHKLLYDVNGGVLRDFLGLIQSTNPAVVIMAEQETEHNVHNMEMRVCNSLRYYSAIFDSVDRSRLSSESPIRTKIEQMFACEIRNLVACEGSDRRERHERFSKWGRIMEQGGFRCMGITERELLQCQMLLKMYSCDSFRVTKQEGQEGEGGGGGEALTLSWSDQPLFTVSGWTPVDVAQAGISHPHSSSTVFFPSS